MAELAAFAAFFAAYAFTRANHVEEFNLAQRALNRDAGAFNTLLLLSASACVVRAVQGALAGRARAAAPWMLAAIFCGLAFLAALYFYNFVSLASLVMVALMPVVLLFQGLFGAIPVALVLMGLIFWKHSENIQRLMAGEEHPWKKKE